MDGLLIDGWSCSSNSPVRDITSGLLMLEGLAYMTNQISRIQLAGRG